MVAWGAGNSFPVKQSVWVDDMGGAGVDSGVLFGTTDISQHRAPVAALCLYGQPFGFTQDDVDEELDMAKCWEEEAALSEEHGNAPPPATEAPEPVLKAMSIWNENDLGMWRKNAESCRRRAALARSRAARMAALLPPKAS